jgi:hypothetical protein
MFQLDRGSFSELAAPFARLRIAHRGTWPHSDRWRALPASRHPIRLLRLKLIKARNVDELEHRPLRFARVGPRPTLE